jgi:serine/threonine protein phosphatase 1
MPDPRSNARPGWLARLLGRETAAAAVPDETIVYAVGDIHGRYDLLQDLLAQIAADAQGKTGQKVLIFLGDYVDRGLQSKEVIDCLAALDWPGWQIVALRGNHDQTMLDFLSDPGIYRAWRDFGAAETLLSYGVAPPRFDDDKAFAAARDELAAKCPARHVKFLGALEYSHTVGDYMFVHAGVRPGVALDRQVAEDLLWIREEFLLSNRRLDKMIVHGHTPAERPIRRANRIGIDTGAYATSRLTAVALAGKECRFLTAGAASRG